MNRTVLIVEDDTIVVKSLELLLRRAGYATTSVTRVADLTSVLERKTPDLVLLDMNFSIDTSGRDGMRMLGQIRAAHPHLPVILMTGWATVQLAVEGMKAGAQDFIAKPWDNLELLAAVEQHVGLGGAAGVKDKGKSKVEPFGRIVGSSPILRETLQQALRVAPTQASVLITGESGTGKELVAEAIHAASARAAGPFVAVNLGGIPPGLFESELFGHRAGAFTDARHDRRGHFELAEGGTLFLDEIGDLDLTAQVKLLRVLQERKYQRLGDPKLRSTNVRILSATSHDLANLVAAGTFREDLLYRINLIHLRLPALRERPADIPELAEHFLASARRRYQRRGLKWSKDALNWLRRQPFPGNVRQLQNLTERTAILAPEDRIGVADIQLNPAPSAAPAPNAAGTTLAEMEVRMIELALARNGGKITATARELGLTRAALYRRLEKFGLSAK